LTYPAQLAHKASYVGQIISRVGQLPQADVAAAQQLPVSAEAVYEYRNKIQMAFSSLIWQQQQQGWSEGQGAVQQGFGLGYFQPGSNSVVLPIQECSLAVSYAKLRKA
jgi:tRNA/tmRNA/rRNA uracil-C5-methylase (TrmA/RlmC/RlmD family)